MVSRRLAGAFAEVLDYPHAPLAGAARACETLAATESGEAGALVARFRAFAEESTVGELQEAYTRAFDLDSLSDLEPTCYPYVGHHLFDENHKRSAFLVGLNERFRAHGFSAGSELPDHVVVLLRFVAACEDGGLSAELVDDALVPGLERMSKGAGEGRTGRELYRGLLRALYLALVAGRPEHATEEAA